jgi:hypothetical protein
VVCSRLRELQEALSAATIALEISSRNARVQALQKRDHLVRARLDLILDQRGADMAGLPGGARGMLVRDYKGKEADRLVTCIGPRGGLAGRGTARPRVAGCRELGPVERETRGSGRRGATDRDYGQVRSTGRSATE